MNNRTTTVQNGTLTIIGSLTDNGTIIGEVAGGVAGAGAGLSVIGDYAAGSGAELRMPEAGMVVSVGGDVDLAIDDGARCDLVNAELRLVGLGAAPQHLELMSEDIGATLAGFERGPSTHFPVGSVRIVTGTTVSTIDVRDNDHLGQAGCEALYAHDLVIQAGATFNTNGCPVYYRTATIDGVVDDPVNLVQVLDCIGDIDGNGAVDVNDLVSVILDWGTDGASNNGDVDGNGIVDVDDLVSVILAWGPC